MVSSTIHIVAAVDTIQALSDGTLDNSLYLMDDGDYESEGKGTPELITLCYIGQLIQWKVVAVDLQTPVAIRDIVFLSPSQSAHYHLHAFSEKSLDFRHQQYSEKELWHDPDLNDWSGIVPSHLVSGIKYHYRFELQLGQGTNSIMSIDTPALKLF
jgi:hypothetical protein